MNDQQLAKKVRKDAAKVKKDFNTLVGDSAVQVGRLGNNVSQVTGKAKGNLTTWAADSVAQWSDGFGKFSGDAKETLADTAATMKKDIGHEMKYLNAKVQQLTGRKPETLAHKAARYPLIGISLALALGFLLGSFIKPSRQALG